MGWLSSWWVFWALGPFFSFLLPLPIRFHDKDSSAVHLFLWKPGFLGSPVGRGWHWERSSRMGVKVMAGPICSAARAGPRQPQVILLIAVLSFT